jgi:hypothetical protein
MKKLLTLIVAFAVVVASCDEQLEIPPVDSLDAGSVFESVDDLAVGMNGLYALFDPEDIIRHSSIFGDDTRVGANNGGQGITLHNWIVDADANSLGIWANHYQTVALANRILEAAANITPEGADETTRYNTIVGEALAWRAYAHFIMLAAYAPDYESGSLGVPYVKEVVVFQQPARNTVGETFAEIKADLAQAASNLPSTGIGTNRWNQDAVTAFLARVALYEGDNATALNLSNTLVANYPLADRAQYVETFQDLGETEMIFKLVKTQNDTRAGGVWHFTGTGGAFMEMSFGMFDAMDPADVRYDVLFDAGRSDIGTDLLQIGKYLGKGGFDYLNDFKIFRSGEMQLIKAEAQAKSGNLSGAAATIKELRDARYGAAQALPTYANLNAALIDIVAERRLELGYEGHRWLDLKRTRSITQQSLSRDSRDCGNGGTPCDLDLNDQRWAIAIPAAEIDANPNMVQNPGY